MVPIEVAAQKRIEKAEEKLTEKEKEKEKEGKKEDREAFCNLSMIYNWCGGDSSLFQESSK